MVQIENRRKVDKVVRKVHEGLKKKYRKIGELHAYHADEITRKRVLRLLACIDDLRIYYLVLDKTKISYVWEKHKHRLYNIAAGLLVIIYLL